MSFIKVEVLLNKHFSLIEKEIEIGLLFTSSELFKLLFFLLCSSQKCPKLMAYQKI